jgi:hypothetical protein
MAVFREGRMIGNRAFKTNTAKPAKGEIEMNFLAQSPLRLGHVLTFDDRAQFILLNAARRPILTRVGTSMSEPPPRIARGGVLNARRA